MLVIGIFKIQTSLSKVYSLKLIVSESITIWTGFFQVDDIIKQHFFKYVIGHIIQKNPY